jgi:hypothetical protein
MAYDSVRKKVILFGTDHLSDTWEYDGCRWQGLQPHVSPGPSTGAMAFDESTGRLTLQANDGSTWQYLQ